MIFVNTIIILFALIVCILLLLIVTDIFLKISRRIIKALTHKRNAEKSLERLLKILKETQVSGKASSGQHTTHTPNHFIGAPSSNPAGQIILSGGGLQQTQTWIQAGGQPIGASIFCPNISIIDTLNEFTQGDAKELLNLLNNKIDALKNTIDAETDEDKKKDLILSLLTLKFLASECARMS